MAGCGKTCLVDAVTSKRVCLVAHIVTGVMDIGRHTLREGARKEWWRRSLTSLPCFTASATCCTCSATCTRHARVAVDAACNTVQQQKDTALPIGMGGDPRLLPNLLSNAGSRRVVIVIIDANRPS